MKVWPNMSALRILFVSALIFACFDCFGEMVLESPLHGDALPSFGRTALFVDTDTGVVSQVKGRPIGARYADYFHECVKKESGKNSNRRIY